MSHMTEARAAKMALDHMIQHLETKIRGDEDQLHFLKSKREQLTQSLIADTPSWSAMATVEEVKNAVEEKRPVTFNFDDSFNYLSAYANRRDAK